MIRRLIISLGSIVIIIFLPYLVGLPVDALVKKRFGPPFLESSDWHIWVNGFMVISGIFIILFIIFHLYKYIVYGGKN